LSPHCCPDAGVNTRDANRNTRLNPLAAELPEAVDVLIGLLALLGFAGSIINGMLYKIVPFLT
jgi:hypothetical protein